MNKRKIRVALLEDQPDLRDIFTTFLEMRGYEVLSYENPAICPLQLSPVCRCASNQRCADIIITDIQMPVVSGLEFIENQKRKTARPLILR
jgi:CheY-like chemotaxis protein